MLLETVGQWQVALYLLGGGIALGALYDVFRAGRRLLRPGKLITVLADVAFCLVALPGLFAMLWCSAAMALRPWMAVGIALGAGIYFAGPSVFLMKGWMALILALRRLWRRLRISRLAAWLGR